MRCPAVGDTPINNAPVPPHTMAAKASSIGVPR